MIRYKTAIKKFGERGEKTGWSYIEIPQELAAKLKPGYKKSFRVKGTLDNFRIEKTSLLPMGGGNFIMPINAGTRKGLGKRKGAIISVKLDADERPFEINKAFMECLKDEPVALEYFNSLPGSHRNYFGKWIDSAKTEETKTRRIARAINALSHKLGYGEMLKMEKTDRYF